MMRPTKKKTSTLFNLTDRTDMPASAAVTSPSINPPSHNLEAHSLVPPTMDDGGLRGSVKEAAGATLGGPAAVLCLKTACQDAVPKCISGPCATPAKGRLARQLCRPHLADCQEDTTGVANCTTRCSRYFTGAEAATCERDCNIARCRDHPPYDGCVAANTLANVLACAQKNCREALEGCLEQRCQITASDVSLVKATE